MNKSLLKSRPSIGNVRIDWPAKRPDFIAAIKINPDTWQIVMDGAKRYLAVIPRSRHLRGNLAAEIASGKQLPNRTIEGALSVFESGIEGRSLRAGSNANVSLLRQITRRKNVGINKAGDCARKPENSLPSLLCLA